jgi:glycosyltransferase involved in cell wall biosynthesis
MKLLFVVNHADFFLSHRLPIALEAQRRGWEVHVATMATPAAQELSNYDLTWHSLPLQPRSMNPFVELRLLVHLLQCYRTLAPDLVHHVTVKPVLYGSIAARLAGVPAVVNALSGLGYLFMAEGLTSRLVRGAIKPLFACALNHSNSILILQNPDDARQFEGLVEKRRIALIRGSGVDVDVFTPVPESEGPPVVVLPSRMLWDKGVAEFVEAARTLKQDGSAARFVLVGDTDSNNPTAVPLSALRRWDREGPVEWWGFQKDMPAVFEKAHVVCLPSYREGLPKVLVEAAACARPIVTTDVPGCREVVQHDVNGLLVPMKNSSALAHALQTLIEDSSRREQFGSRGRQMVERGLSLDKVVSDTLRVYERLS